jgi:hypothetical protein
LIPILAVIWKGGLKPKHKKPLIDLITSNIAEINKQVSFLRCCNSETAVWFANIQWPATCKALETEDWNGAIAGFSMMVSPMAKIRDRIFYIEETLDALELIWLNRVNPLRKLKDGNLNKKEKQFLIGVMAPYIAKIKTCLNICVRLLTRRSSVSLILNGLRLARPWKQRIGRRR